MYEKACRGVFRVCLGELDFEGLKKLSVERNLGLSADEMSAIAKHFISEGRDPYDIELEAFAQSWSEHCCYKSSKNILKDTIFNVKSKDVICAISEDAAVVDFEGDWAYVVKMESHNHPSALDPYGGAATGVGGVLRDIVCMGAQPIALVDPLFFGPLEIPHDNVPEGSKHPRYLFRGVVSGIADYGNRVGIPTIAGMVYFDRGYVSNCLVNAGCIGLVKKDMVLRSKVGSCGDKLILAGGKTGRDGIHGVTFASQELHEGSESSDRAAVQLGYAIMKEPLIHACLEAGKKGLLTGLKDFGGGGLSCVSAEMLHAAGCGGTIYLDRVPLKEPDIPPWQIWVSESQERMMLSVAPDDVDAVLEIFEFWDVPATLVGEADDGKNIRAYWEDIKVLDLNLDFLLGGVCYDRPFKIVEEKDTCVDYPMPDLKEAAFKLMGCANIGSRESIIRRYDHEVRAKTVLKPMQGRVSLQTHGDASVLKPLEDSFRGLAVTCDVNPALCRASPYWGAASAVDEAVRNLTAVNAKAHTIVDCLNFANPEKPERLGEFKRAVEGMHYAAESFGIPFVSGNVSLYNEGSSGPIAPTPALMTLGMVKDIRKCVTSDLKGAGNSIYIVGETFDELRASQFFLQYGIEGGKIPRVNPERTMRDSSRILEAMDEGLIMSCHDVSEGGLLVTLAEMCFGAGLGACIDLSCLGDMRTDIKLFSESNGRWICEVGQKDTKRFEQVVGGIRIGEVFGDVLKFSDHVNQLTLDIGMLRDAWSNAIGPEVPK